MPPVETARRPADDADINLNDCKHGVDRPKLHVCLAGAGCARPRGMKAGENRRVRYAVIGAGNIAQVAVLPAFQHARENSELVALVSGDAEKRRVLRERYSLELDGDYDALERILAEGRIDAVYIATPKMRQEMHRPPVSKPEPVNAPGPSVR